MANPRQRRKSRSGTAKNTLSKSSRKNAKKVTVKGPTAVVAAWDRTKTVRENYAALGLAATPNIIGNTTNTHSNAAFNQENAPSGSMLPPPLPDHLPEGVIPKGYARIERDSEGNIVNVTYADEDAEEVQESETPSTPWGEPMADLDDLVEDSNSRAKDLQGVRSIEGIARPTRTAKESTKVVAALEEDASKHVYSKKRFASAQEIAWLKDMGMSVIVQDFI